jgi:hypothetical protein
MITKTNIKVSLTQSEVIEALNNLPTTDYRYILNEPSGHYMYDGYKIKEEFKNTLWDRILSTLPWEIGQARIIVMQPGQCYQTHADIDNRWHLNLTGEDCFFTNLDTCQMYPIEQDWYWYDFDASPRHSAVNFGRTARAQLVVRKPIKKNTLIDPIHLEIKSSLNESDTRYYGENFITPWFNKALLSGTVSDVDTPAVGVIRVMIERSAFSDFNKMLPNGFTAIRL